MNLPPLSKRAVLHGALFSFLILLIIMDLPLGQRVEKVSEPEKVLDVTRDVFLNPFLGKKENWKVNQSVLFAEEQDWAQNETAGNLDALEILMENSLMVSKDTSPVYLQVLALPETGVRPETVAFDVKNTAENKLTRVANSKTFVHIVKAGETIYDISRIYGIDIQTIIGANLDKTNLGKLKVGQEIRILNTKGTIHKITHYETLSDVADLYNVSVQKIIDYNGIKGGRIKAGDTVVVPGANPTNLACRGGYLEGYAWPLVVSGKFTSGFGTRWGRPHNGIDLAVPIGTTILAAKSGKVIFSGVASGYGNAVYIKHDDNTVTRYGHNDKNLVKKDEFVYAGQPIAKSGNTGTSTGPHLHFEIRIKNKAVNPLGYLK